jgi:hypothetical protein
MVMSEAKKRILNVHNTSGHFQALTTLVKRRNRKFSDVVAALAQVGERFTKDDLRTSEGPIGQLIQTRGSNQISSMVLIEEIVTELAKHGEVITPNDWLTTQNRQGNALTWAARNGLLHKVFAPLAWVDRAEDMDALWSHVPEKQRTLSDYDSRRDRARQLSTPEFKINPGLRKEELITVAPAIGHAPFQDQRTWKKWESIIAALHPGNTAAPTGRVLAHAFNEIGGSNNSITKADLFKSGSGSKPFLKIAAEAGVLPQVIKYLEDRGETFGRDDYIKAGLEELIRDVDVKLYRAAEEGSDDTVRSLVSTRIPNLEAQHGQQQLTPLLGAASKGKTSTMRILLEANADPDARSGKIPSFSVLWGAAKHADDEGIGLVVAGLKRKYHDDAIKLLDSLLIIHDGSSPLDVVRKADKKDAAKLLKDTINETSDAIVCMPERMLAEHVVGRKSGMELLTDSGQLPRLFTARRWLGNPRGMHALAIIW